MRHWLTLVFLALTLPSLAADDGFVRIKPDGFDWKPSIRPGLSAAVVAGDPAKPGFYIIRARFAAGHFTRPHIHPSDRHVTVIKGTWWTGTGTDFNPDATVPLGPGSYMKHPAGMAHWDGAKDEDVEIEIKGIGPAPTWFVNHDGEIIERH